MLVTPPAIEPLTIEEAKLRAGLDWVPGDPRDDLMAAFLQAARNQVERDTGVGMLTQTHDVPVVARGARVDLPWRPVQSVVVAGVDASAYTVDLGSVDPRPASLTRGVGLGCWPADLRATIVVGFASVAALQASAPGLVHAVGLLVAHYATLGRDLAVVAPGGLLEIPMGYEDAIAPYRLVVLA